MLSFVVGLKQRLRRPIPFDYSASIVSDLDKYYSKAVDKWILLRTIAAKYLVTEQKVLNFPPYILANDNFNQCRL